jgi:hypothetical protein
MFYDIYNFIMLMFINFFCKFQKTLTVNNNNKKSKIFGKKEDKML